MKIRQSFHSQMNLMHIAYVYSACRIYPYFSFSMSLCFYVFEK